MRVSIKPYACCRYNHGLIDCVLQLARDSIAIAPRRRRARSASACSAAARCWWPSRSSRSATRRTWSTRSSARRTRRPRRWSSGTGGIDAYTPSDCATRACAIYGAHRLLSRTRRSTRAIHGSGRRRPRSSCAMAACCRRAVDYATGEPENPVPRAALIDKFVSLGRGSRSRDPRGLAERILGLGRTSATCRGLGAGACSLTRDPLSLRQRGAATAPCG